MRAHSYTPWAALHTKSEEARVKLDSIADGVSKEQNIPTVGKVVTGNIFEDIDKVESEDHMGNSGILNMSKEMDTSLGSHMMKAVGKASAYSFKIDLLIFKR